MYPWLFSDFLVEKDIDFKRPTHVSITVDGEEPGDEYEDYETDKRAHFMSRSFFGVYRNNFWVKKKYD
jgi:hypothetical protein